MNFRVGITIGDVVEREGDLLGEGVNIASRLEGIAPAGGMCISRSVYEAVANKISLKFADVGEQQLKNLPDRVHAYTVTLEQPETRQQLQQSKALATPVWGGVALALFAALATGAYITGNSKYEIAADTTSAAPTAPPKPPETIMQLATTPPPPVEETTSPDSRHTNAPDSAGANGEKVDVAKDEQTDEQTDEVKSCTRTNPSTGSLFVVPCDERPAGEWTGLLTENDGDTYRVEITLQRDGNGTISYPKLKCTGTLEYTLHKGATYVFRETITKGTVCGKTADVELTVTSPDGSTVDYNWIGEGPTVTGKLTGVMTAGPTAIDACLKYLQNRGTMINVPCKPGSKASDGPP